jgi:putative SOS response-associated peptidase YedK
MCGRYASSRGADDLVAHFGVEEPPEEELAPSYNVAPTDPVPVVLERSGTRRLKVVRWGLVPSWAKDAKGAARLINARSETLATSRRSARRTPGAGASCRRTATTSGRRTATASSRTS